MTWNIDRRGMLALCGPAFAAPDQAGRPVRVTVTDKLYHDAIVMDGNLVANTFPA